mgnify:CR=1 FL=1
MVQGIRIGSIANERRISLTFFQSCRYTILVNGYFDFFISIHLVNSITVELANTRKKIELNT